MITNLDQIVEKAKSVSKMKLAVAAAEDKHVLQAVFEAKKLEIIEPVLIGDSEKIKDIASNLQENIEGIEIINTNGLVESAIEAVKLVSSKKADFVMKGLLDTSILLKEVLNKEYGLRDESLLSHVMVYETDSYNKLLMLTDGGMNIAPDKEQKEKILKNAIKVARAFEIENIKVGVICAKEKVSEKMPSTTDAKYLADRESEFGPNVIVEGPVAFDIAISKEAAKVKNFDSRISEEVDILVVPTIEVGNALGKSLTYMCGAKSAGIIMGAKSPIVLVSRADSDKSKLYSIALGALVANNIQN